MKATIKWTQKKNQYIIDNYRKLPTKEIAMHLKTTPNIVRCQAVRLRKKGEPVQKYPPTNQWKNNKENNATLKNLYGVVPTHKIAEKFRTTVPAIYRAARKMNLRFHGNDGRYTFSELARKLKIREKSVRSWVKFGLEISGYAKDGLTNPSMPRKKEELVKKFNALIDLSDLKRFLMQRPETYDLRKLNAETRHLLELTKIKMIWKEKRMYCKNCKYYFWAELHNPNVNCRKCGRFLGKWSKNKYRT